MAMMREVEAEEAAGGCVVNDVPMSIEKVFEGETVPSWREQLTFRAFVVSSFLSVMFSAIVMKLSLTTGITPSLNVSTGLLSILFVKTWTKLLDNVGLPNQPFTRQENTVIQTCVVASTSISGGGFGSYLFAMSGKIANQSLEQSKEQNIKEPKLGWMIGFLFVVSFLGLFSIMTLRKIMIIDYKLIYPSGTATAYLINAFHTLEGAMLAKKQVNMMGKSFVGSFAWGFFKWFYTAGNNCGFASFPSLGLKAYANKFFFDFSATFVGVGMICPYLVNISMLLGGILSWGIMWPLIGSKKGDWYPADLEESSLHGLQGYQLFIGIALILGDGPYNFFKVLSRTISGMVAHVRSTQPVLDDGEPAATTTTTTTPAVSFDDKRLTELFLKEQIPNFVAFGRYVLVAVVSIITVPHIFHPLKWYHILVGYVIAPMLAFCNVYCCGLTDWSLASTYGKIAIFTIGGWAGASHDGVLAGLATCGIMMSIVSTASDLMQDFKTGYLTLASSRSMFISQVIGTAMGCIVAPCIFWLFYKAFTDLGTPGTEYPAPYALAYRTMAILGVEGFGSLPKHCLTLCYVFFTSAIAIAIAIVKDLVPKKVSKYIPLPMAMAIPFYIGTYVAIGMCVGSLIVSVWEKINKAKADVFAPAMASGLISGDGLWTLPQSVLELTKVKPPICMKFLSRAPTTWSTLSSINYKYS